MTLPFYCLGHTSRQGAAQSCRTPVAAVWKWHHTPTYFFLKDRSFQLFCLRPLSGLAQLFPMAQFSSDSKDCVRLLEIRIRKLKSNVRGKSSKFQVTIWCFFSSVYHLININSNSQVKPSKFCSLINYMQA